MKKLLLALGIIFALPIIGSATSLIGTWIKTKGPASIEKYYFIDNSFARLTMGDSSSISLTYILDMSKSPSRITWYSGPLKVNLGIWTFSGDTLIMQGSGGDTLSFPTSFADPSHYLLIANNISNLLGNWTLRDGPSSIIEFRFSSGPSSTMMFTNQNTQSFNYILDTLSAPKRITFYSGSMKINLGIWLIVGNVLTMQGSGGDTLNFPSSFTQPSHYVMNATIVNDYRSSILSCFELLQNYPNPFNPSTTIQFFVPSYSFVTIKVYDVLGHEVATVIDALLDAGLHSVQWYPTELSSGAYFYQMRSGSFIETKRFLLLK